MSDITQCLSPQSALQPLALQALGRTGADIERLIREVRQRARREKRDLTWADIEHALGDQRMVMSDDLRWRVSVHETGHAIAWTLLRIGEVESITIGIQDIGQVTVLRHTHLAQTEDWLARTMAAVLAGRVAEQIVFGEVLAGSGGGEDSDLAKATGIALGAETSLGFAERQPLLYRPATRGFDMLTLDRELADRVNARLLAAEDLARRLLEEHEAKLMEIAIGLNESGVMSGDEVRRLLGMQR
ncbi:hypothetical protein [Hoeflea sp. BAL378]|uniref:hypothetical protein n=1 Tax=Hoeflea sp. BAL378 TaxID=1547437 RepID=UPI0006903406|nr:hypothetical protein [Hoeflea sp. BAL378]